MAANQPPLPREWLMTDERIGDRLWEAIQALPRGAGVVFRHHSLPVTDRASLAHQIADICRIRGLGLAMSRDSALARQVNAALIHNPSGDPAALPVSRSAHSPDEAKAATDAGASLIFLSPLFPTRSHPGQPPLARAIAREIVAASPVPVIALGGMNRSRFDALRPDGFYGWAGIDAWLAEIRT